MNEVCDFDLIMAKEIKLISISDLEKYPNNARTHSPDQIDDIIKSMQEFGFTNPILTDGKNGIIAGHGRLEAAKKMNLRSVPVIELSHLSENQKRAYIIADNKLAERAGWNTDILKLEIEELKQENFNLSIIGLTDLDLTNLFEIDEINRGDETSEWVNLSEEFNARDNEIKLTVIFNNEQEREDYVREKNIKITTKRGNGWTLRLNEC